MICMGDAPTPNRDHWQMADSITSAHPREEDPALRRRARCLLLCSVVVITVQIFTVLRIGQDGAMSPCDESVCHSHEAKCGAAEAVFREAFETLDSDTCGMTGIVRGREENSTCVHNFETMTRSDCVAMVFATLVIAVTITEEIKAARGAYEAAPAYLESPRKNQLGG